ncbi:manganese efflux pump [candidate division WOR-3 bacterium]|nr:manganese efflux pump [candidate division WOR-3 bacterium]
MYLINIITIALGLSMDAFSVSITEGAVAKVIKKRYIILIAFTFGLFQAFMPLIGWGIGNLVFSYIERYNKIIGLCILVFLGLKMIYEAIKNKGKKIDQQLGIKRLLLLAIATSIDALAIGFTLDSLRASIFTSILIIGMITFLFSALGVVIGKYLGLFLKEKAEIFGGIILILVGIKIYAGF